MARLSRSLLGKLSSAFASSRVVLPRKWEYQIAEEIEHSIEAAGKCDFKGSLEHLARADAALVSLSIMGSSYYEEARLEAITEVLHAFSSSPCVDSSGDDKNAAYIGLGRGLLGDDLIPPRHTGMG